MTRWLVGGMLAFCLCGPASAQHYTMRMRSILGPDGTVAFGCISQPYVGAVAFVPSAAYRSGIAAIVVPQTAYRAFFHRRYPAPWYVAAAADYAAGRAFTPAVRAFYEATRRDVTVPYMTEGTSFGGLGSSRVPLDPGLDEAILAQVDAAIGNCSVVR